MRLRISFCVISLIIFIWLLSITSINAIAVNDAGEFNISYFIPHTGYKFSYTSILNNNHTFDFITNWEELDPGVYKRIHNNNDGSQDYSIYQLYKDDLIGCESGFEVPNSEGNVEKVLEGNNIVFQKQTPGGFWLSQYKTLDSYNNTSEYKCTYKYTGLENINVLGQNVQAAKLLWEKECTVTQQSIYSEWRPVPALSKGEDWYVEGIGLVKRTYSIRHKDSQELSGIVLLTEILDSKRM